MIDTSQLLTFNSQVNIDPYEVALNIPPGLPLEALNSPASNSSAYKAYLATMSTDYVLLGAIITCESGWHPAAANKHSSAKGMFQFLDSTWNKWGTGNVLNPYDNIRAGIKLYEAQGTTPWDSSKSCWHG